MTVIHPIADAMKIISENEEIFVRNAGSVQTYFRVTKTEALKALINRLHWIDAVRLHATETALYIEGLE